MSDVDPRTQAVLTDVKFWLMVIADAHGIVIVSPENESRVKSLVDARGVGGIIEVQVSRHVPDDRVYVFAPNALSGVPHD